MCMICKQYVNFHIVNVYIKQKQLYNNDYCDDNNTTMDGFDTLELLYCL